jgi:hypothetical protein
MDTPFEGLITVSATPMRNALAHMLPAEAPGRAP